jgi:putative phage-type endonuclease
MNPADRPKDGLGASDAAAVLGVSRWHSPLAVWLDKTTPSEPEKKEEHQSWGLLLEPPLAARYTQDTGRRLRRVGLLRSKEHPILYAHCDRLVVGEPGIVEIKVSSNSWKGEIPLYYKTQAIQQMIVTDREWVDFAVLERGQKFATPIPRLERDRSIEPDFIAELEDWWDRYVVKGERPPMDGADAGKQYLRAQFARSTGAEIVATAEMLPLVDQYKLVYHNRRQVEQEEERIKQEIKALIGDGGTLVGPFGSIAWTRFEAAKTDWKLYAQALAGLIKEAAPDEIGTMETLKGLYTNRIQSERFTPRFIDEEES